MIDNTSSNNSNNKKKYLISFELKMDKLTNIQVPICLYLYMLMLNICARKYTYTSLPHNLMKFYHIHTYIYLSEIDQSQDYLGLQRRKFRICIVFLLDNFKLYILCQVNCN